jgi:hypothetical protein
MEPTPYMHAVDENSGLRMATKRASSKRPYRLMMVLPCALVVLVTGLALVSGSRIKEIVLNRFRVLFDTASSVTGITLPASGANVSVAGGGSGLATGLDISATGCPGQAVVGIAGGNGQGAGRINITVGGTGPATGVRVAANATPCK